MKTIFPGILVFFLFFSEPPLHAYTTEDCIACHRTGSGKSVLLMNPEEYNRSVHAGEITCSDCHKNVIGEEHITARESGSVDCGQCHEQQNRHGVGSEKGTRPHCSSCHTRHGILKSDHEESSVHPEQLKRTCGACHAAQAGNAAFLPWLASLTVKTHGKQDLSCNYDKQDCLGCHQGQAAHGEETAINDRSCPACHFPSNDQAPLMGAIHPSAESRTTPWNALAKGVYGLTALLLLVGGFGFTVRRLSNKKPNRKRRQDAADLF